MVFVLSCSVGCVLCVRRGCNAFVHVERRRDGSIIWSKPSVTLSEPIIRNHWERESVLKLALLSGCQLASCVRVAYGELIVWVCCRCQAPGIRWMNTFHLPSAIYTSQRIIKERFGHFCWVFYDESPCSFLKTSQWCGSPTEWIKMKVKKDRMNSALFVRAHLSEWVFINHAVWRHCGWLIFISHEHLHEHTVCRPPPHCCDRHLDMKQLKIWDVVLNPETRSHFITSCYMGGLDAKATSNIILSLLPSDNAGFIVWKTSAVMKTLFGFLRSGSDRWRKRPEVLMHSRAIRISWFIWGWHRRARHVGYLITFYSYSHLTVSILFYIKASLSYIYWTLVTGYCASQPKSCLFNSEWKNMEDDIGKIMVKYCVRFGLFVC